ncbi:hypothetical protein OSCT_0812 [Oscillochloris trichoides DG-6]|uniref:VCBS repeat-containing protein n=1 Tax=Oscillochloris trichoides DG-6 TaxID=765420 RepID=E1IBW1_9CHLR|nr:hypothetical protein [Oscillochloris trichoides]EFO81341.1 hypothetical protein OSCT_0812 [Oscillochloris trichoides DG-6]
MAVTSREIHETRLARQIPLAQGVGPFAYLVTGLLAILAIYVLVGTVVDWAQVRIDDIRYGRPRTTQIAGLVGHGAEAANQPTRFIGLNLNRQVVVLELPAGDPNQVRSLPGPYLFGANEDLTPVLLSLQDMDRDGRADLIVDVRNEQVVYLNRDGFFRLPTTDEQQQLLEEHGP